MEASLELRVGGEVVFTSSGKWLHPLFELSEFVGRSGIDAAAGKVRDKVVGRGSAFLIVRLGIRRVHAGLLSRLGLGVLEGAGVEVTWDTLVERIECATESLLQGITDGEEAYRLLASRRATALLRGAPKASA
jgi:zinc transport system ATP-binding protein